MPYRPRFSFPPCPGSPVPLRSAHTNAREKGKIIATALVIRTGPGAGRRIEVEGPMTIGREEADITIEDPEISRRHAEVRLAGVGIEIEDLGSTNGTFLNGSRIDSATALQPGDTLRVGQVELHVEDPSASGGTAVAPAGGTAISQSPPPVSQSGDTDPGEAETQAWQPASDGPASEPAAAYPPPPSGLAPPPGATDPSLGAYPPSQSGYTPPPAPQPYSPPQGPPTYSAPPSYQSGPQPPAYGSPSQTKAGGNKTPLIIGAVVALLAIIAIVLFVFPGVLKQSDEDKVREVVVTFGEEFGNGEALCDLFTSRFLEEQFGETGDAATQACVEQVDAQDQDSIDITIKSIDVQGERATVEADVDAGDGVEPGTMELENEDGEWLVDSVE